MTYSSGQWKQQGCLRYIVVPELDSQYQSKVCSCLHRSHHSRACDRGSVVLQEKASEEENISTNGWTVSQTCNCDTLWHQHRLWILCHAGISLYHPHTHVMKTILGGNDIFCRAVYMHGIGARNWTWYFQYRYFWQLFSIN